MNTIIHKNNFVVGVDIGGTNTMVGIVSSNGICSKKMSFKTDADDPNVFCETLIVSINELKCSIVGDFKGIGIAAPAANDREGSIHNSANLRWGNFPIVSLLQQHFSVPITVINDSNAAALGEMTYGAAKGMKNFIIVTLGTGLGAGIVVNGKIMTGAFGSAGEIGHMILEENGRMCGCQRHGCVETYVSATGLRRTVFEQLARSNEKSVLRTIAFNDLTAEAISELALKNDRIAIDAFAMTGNYLGRTLANVVAAFDPEVIILSGGLMNAGDLILQPTIDSFKQNALHFQKEKIVIRKSNIRDGEGAVIGASSIIFEMIVSQLDFVPEVSN